jgi:hypothetical protein
MHLESHALARMEKFPAVVLVRSEELPRRRSRLAEWQANRRPRVRHRRPSPSAPMGASLVSGFLLSVALSSNSTNSIRPLAPAPQPARAFWYPREVGLSQPHWAAARTIRSTPGRPVRALRRRYRTASRSAAANPLAVRQRHVHLKRRRRTIRSRPLSFDPSLSCQKRHWNPGRCASTTPVWSALPLEADERRSCNGRCVKSRAP